jgi:hypothetical protein
MRRHHVRPYVGHLTKLTKSLILSRIIQKDLIWKILFCHLLKFIREIRSNMWHDSTTPELKLLLCRYFIALAFVRWSTWPRAEVVWPSSPIRIWWPGFRWRHSGPSSSSSCSWLWVGPRVDLKIAVFAISTDFPVFSRKPNVTINFCH